MINFHVWSKNPLTKEVENGCAGCIVNIWEYNSDCYVMGQEEEFGQKKIYSSVPHPV